MVGVHHAPGSQVFRAASRRAATAAGKKPRGVGSLLDEVEVAARLLGAQRRGYAVEVRGGPLRRRRVGEADREEGELAGQGGDRAGALRRERPSAPPAWRSSTESRVEPESGPAASTSASIAAASSAPSIAWLAVVGDRVARVHVELGDPRRRLHREGVHRRPEGAQRLEQRTARLLAAEEDGLHERERLAAHRLGDLGERRELQDAADRGDLLGRRLRSTRRQASRASPARSSGKKRTPA